jgi:uncharacterized protein YunC (DUF1805 family)
MELNLLTVVHLSKGFLECGRLLCKTLNLCKIFSPLLFLKSLFLSFCLSVRSSFFSSTFVVPSAIAFVAQTSRKSYSICMRALSRFLLSPILTVADFAHSLSIMLGIDVRTVFDAEPGSTFVGFFDHDVL